MSTTVTESDHAPIILFVYKRLAHTAQVITSLQANKEAASSELYIYSDAAKSVSDEAEVNAVRSFAGKVTGFKAAHLHVFDKNQGLASAITQGVSAVIAKHGRVIVLEDDVIVSPSFLEYMNNALNKYQHQKTIWHISGWNYPIKTTAIHTDVFFLRTMNCWGWGTWDDRWQHYEKNPHKLLNSWSTSDIKAFNLDHHVNFWSQVKKNAQGKLNTWAIFWYSTIFSHQGLCVNPTHSLTLNIGHDGSGENCGSIDYYARKLSDQRIQTWPNELKENPHAISAIKQYHRRPSLLLNKLRAKIRRCF